MLLRAIAVLSFICASLAASESWNDPALDANVASVVPAPEEARWLEIPWRSNLLSACQEAQTQGRPVFLWIMNGNPLGCV